jgi:hypothetical protein
MTPTDFGIAFRKIRNAEALSERLPVMIDAIMR